MDEHLSRRSSAGLWALALLAVLYTVLVGEISSQTGIALVDGTIGVLLGLYICSHPVGNAIDLLFAERAALRAASSEWAGIGWLVLNLLVLAAGWMVVVIGATRYVGST